jgi:hypothetical protein
VEEAEEVEVEVEATTRLALALACGRPRECANANNGGSRVYGRKRRKERKIPRTQVRPALF